MNGRRERMPEELEHADLVRAWSRGEPLPPDVAQIKEWLERECPGGCYSEEEAEKLAAQAGAEGWEYEAIEGALLLWQLSNIREEGDKPAA